jgi:predicted dehydrogenase
VTGEIVKIETTVHGNELIISNRASNDFKTIQIEPDPRVKEQGLHHGASYLEHLGFIEAINNGAPPAVTVRDGLLSVVLGVAAQQSIESGQAVNLRDLL